VIPCPRCGGQNTSARSRQSNKRPKIVRNAVIRLHVCGDCAMEFRSYQIVIQNRATAEAIEDALSGVA
jgi:hypothetical protein